MYILIAQATKMANIKIFSKYCIIPFTFLSTVVVGNNFFILFSGPTGCMILIKSVVLWLVVIPRGGGQAYMQCYQTIADARNEIPSGTEF